MLRPILLATALLVVTSPLIGQEKNPFVSGIDVPAGAVGVIDGKTIGLKRFVDALYVRFKDHVRGTEALENLIQKRIVEINRKKQGLDITAKDIDAEYKRLADALAAETGGSTTIEDQLKEAGRTREEFMETLRFTVALKRMTAKEFAREDVSPADQAQWLRSKTIEADIVRDENALPRDAAARVYTEHITRTDFARAVIRMLPSEDVVALITAMMQADLAETMLRENGLELSRADEDAEFARAKRRFQEDPKLQGLKFEDFIRERAGLTPESYRRSANFRREACLSLVGEALLPDSETTAAYKKQLEHYGPVYELRHIFIRGSDHPDGTKVTRTKPEAKAEAEKILARLRKGENFEEAVKLYSEDPRSKFKRGELGSFTPKAAERFTTLSKDLPAMKAGDFAGPVESKVGFHVIKLHAKRPAPPLSESIVTSLRKRTAAEEFKRRWRDAKRGIDLRVLTKDG